MIGIMPDTWGRGPGLLRRYVPVLYRRVQEAGDDELRAWRAGCIERCLSGSGRLEKNRAEILPEYSGKSKAKHDTSLAAYAIDEGGEKRF
jgi:hypothetical protein